MNAIRSIAILFAILPCAAGAGPRDVDRVVRLSEPVAVTETHEVFGEPLDMSRPAVSLRQLVEHRVEYAGRDVLIETRVAQVCQKKGCFFIATDGDVVARVTFKDYGFFIPTDSTGKRVLLAGVLQPSQLTAEQALHYASDLGDSSPAAVAGIEYQIVARAVAVPRS